MNLEQLQRITIDLEWTGTKGAKTAVRNSGDVVAVLGPDTPVVGITSREVHTLIAALRERGLAGSTINRKLSALSKMLGVAVEQGELEAAPRIRWQKEPEGRLRWLSKAEELRLLNPESDETAFYRALLVFLLDTGARLGEALDLRWCYVPDLEDRSTRTRVTFVQTKGQESRSVPLTTRTVTSLRRTRRYRGTSQEGPFSCLTPSTAAKRFAALRQRAGIGDDVVLHTLRHTCASRLAQRGIPLPVIQKWLGHADIATTMRYAHLAPDALDTAVEALEG